MHTQARGILRSLCICFSALALSCAVYAYSVQTAYAADSSSKHGAATSQGADQTTASATYDYQGNDVQIKMLTFNPAVSPAEDGATGGASGSASSLADAKSSAASDAANTSGYSNTLSDVTAADGFYTFTYAQTNGTGPDIAAYASRNAGNIKLYRVTDTNTELVASLGDDVLTLTGAAKTKEPSVQLPSDALTPGTYTLTFEAGYMANNGLTLGVPVSFTFTIQ